MDTLEVNGHDLPVHRYHTIVVGSGAAALNCAEHLVQFGVGDIAVVTDQLGGGTSHNSGSDKQTYYKSGNIGEQPESPMDHAKTLMAGGCMHGDVAYAEAVGSLQEFYHLVQNGVPFPHDIHGGYVGYKTDHDPLQRATSAGPKTSQFMVETSLKQIHRNNTAVFNRMEVIRLLTADTSDGKRVVGAVAIDKSAADDRSWGMTLFQAQNIVMATGGPGEMYECSAYPHRQIGNHGIMFEAGAAAHNLSESQFGMASTSYRWNLSGTYQQVMPNYFSANEDGGDKRNFLTDYFDDMGAMASNIFLKGYQWPLDPQKIDGPGSSIIDIAVWCETALKNRRVFMDFIQNPAPGPAMKPFDLGDLWPEAHDYLEKSDAMIPELPIARLWRMNPPSIEQYAEHGIDLETEPLELAVVCQHNNGGFVVDSWWRTTIDHLFCLGELAGTHGVKRPGGSSLNATQVGGLRAAEYISRRRLNRDVSASEFENIVGGQVEDEIDQIERLIALSESAPKTIDDRRREIQHRMSSYAAHIRSAEGVEKALAQARSMQTELDREGTRIGHPRNLVRAIQNVHLCKTHIAYLQAISALLERGSGSRGSHLVLSDDGERLHPKLGDDLRYLPENTELRNEIIEIRFRADSKAVTKVVDVRPLPEDSSWFEDTWASFRDGSLWA